MPFAPPSYQAASYRQHWIIIAPYVQNHDLYAACLVSRYWHQIFSPYLWGNPGSRFGFDNDTIYLSITRFKRLLTKARHDVRRLTHTLHIPPAQPEFYGGPQAGWLKEILDHLPSLQALIVSNLSFFDHQCLQAHQGRTRAAVSSPSKYSLRLLIASECENTTAHSLGIALSQFPELMYLDLSGAQGSRSPYVLHQIACLQELKVLKLRNCGLRDEDIEYLAFTKNLRCLDVSFNFLTERGISRLLTLIPAEILVERGYLGTSITSPSSPRATRTSLQPQVFVEDLEALIINRLTSSVSGSLQVEEGLPSTFTNLRLASNYITIDGLNRIIKYPTIRSLDCGALNLSEQPNELLSPCSPTSLGSKRFLTLPELEVLSPALLCSSFRNLTSLRIHHSIITSYPFFGKELPLSEQCFELHSEDLRFELDGRDTERSGPCFELQDTSESITHELEVERDADLTKNTDSGSPDGEKGEEEEESHATFESPDDVAVQMEKNLSQNIKSNSAGSPVDKSEDIPCRPFRSRMSIRIQSPQAPTSHPVQCTGSFPDGPEQYRYNYKAGPESPWRALEQRPKPSGLRDLIDEITQRQHRIGARERHPGRFKPSMLPNLRTLMLTDVPIVTRRRHIPSALALFIQECAEEEELARLEALANHQPVHPQPGSLGPTIKLCRIVLEMSSQPEPNFLPSSPLRSPRSKRASITKSSTEDADSELFMNNSESDFSFFGEDDGGLLISEGRVDRPLRGEQGLILDSDDGRLVDCIAELVSFRRERKQRFEALGNLVDHGCKHLEMDIALLGHWRGEIKVVR